MDSCVRCGRQGGIDPSGLCPACATKPAPTIDQYKLLKELHESNGSTLYLAWATEQNRHVAVKLFPPLSDARKKRFLREAKTWTGLKHPNLLPLHDFGSVSSGPLNGHYVVTDYVNGTSLADSRLPVKKELEILLEVAEGLSLLHKKNLIHRNVKPSNILLTPEGRGLLTDFAFGAPEPGEEPSAPTGTPYFTSAEQAQGTAELTPASDVYSLGATLYFLLTGVPPFSDARTFQEYLSLISVTRPLAPSQLNREISKDFESLVFKSMDSNLDKRIKKVEEFVKLLREALRKGTVPAGILRKRSVTAAKPPVAVQAGTVTTEMARQIDARLETIETLLSHTEQTTRKIGSNEGNNLESSLKACLALHPGNPKTHWLLGRLYLLLDKGDESLESLNQSIALGGDVPSALYYRALLRLQQLQLKRGLPGVTVSEKAIEFAFDTTPSSEEAELRTLAVEDLKALTDAYGAAGDLRQFFTRGVQELFEGNVDIGFELLKRAAGMLPQNAEAQLYYGVSCIYKKDLDKALEAFGKAAQLRKSGLLLRYLILCHEARGTFKKQTGEDSTESYREALKASDELVKLESDSVDAWIQRGLLLKTVAESQLRINQPCTREVKEALEITRKMIDKHPEVAPFYNLRGEMRRTLAETWQNRGEPATHLLDQAISEYRRALEIDANYFPGLVNLSSVLIMRSREKKAKRDDLLQEAMQLCVRARELNPTHALPLSVRGQCHFELGQKTDAVSDWKEAIKINPALTPALQPLIEKAELA